MTADSLNARKNWARLLGVKLEQISVTLKRRVIRGRHKHDNYIGLVSMEVPKSAWLNRRIEFWIKGAAEKFLKE